MEAIVKEATMKFLEQNYLLSDLHHGFRQNRSCLSSLLLSTEQWTRALDEDGRVDVIYTNFKKAFDSVPHKRLIYKLSEIGITGRLLTWITDFLTGRSQTVCIEASTSTPTPVLSGVPQGSVIGPLLFLVYINDCVDNLGCSVIMFADDVKLWRPIRSDADRFAGEVFAKFTNGISYEYTPGFVPSCDFLLEPKNYKLVAKKMAHLHTLPIRETVRRFLSDDEFVVDEEPCVLKHIHRYIELLPSDDFPQKNSMTVQKAKNDNEQKRTYPPEYPSRTDLLQEARFLEKLLKGAKSPVAFCHNDLPLSNVIISPSQDSVTFIDFEYCGYNHTAYDIAVHFSEFAGNRDTDFSRCPSEAMQRDWLRTYLSTVKGITSSSPLSLEHGDSSLILQSVSDEEIDDWMQEVRLFTMACHLLWGIWGMVQTFRSNIAFDFKAYALAKIALPVLPTITFNRCV
ncbi:Ethanolamine kinase [Sparganum proliferum]